MFKPANSTFKPERILMYGVQGIGKNTFASTFESPVIIQTEEGSQALPDYVQVSELVTSLDDLYENIGWLLNEDHEFKTVILDTLDWLEPIMWRACSIQNNWKGIEEPGYGKGYIALDSLWQIVMGGFDKLRDRGITIVVLAHSEIKRVEPPDNDPYDMYQIKVHKRASALWQEWADMVLFANYRIFTKKAGGSFDKDKKKAIGSGERVIYTNERPAWRAKNRWSLPDEIYIGKDKTYSAFHNALEEATSGKYKSPVREVNNE